MFNTTVVMPTRTEHVTQEVTKTVHEHRAPTDDSIRIFNEMQEKAEQSVVAKITIDNNELSGALAIRHDQYNWKHEAIFRFLLNDKEYTGRFDVSDDSDIQTFFETLSGAIAQELMKTNGQALTQLLRTSF